MGQDRLVAVTGAGGFLGRRVCAALAREGYRTRALVRDGSGAVEPAGVSETLIGDLADKDLAPRLLEGACGVFHLAGIVGKAGVLASDYWEVHVTSTKRLLAAARKQGVRRFIHCSSASIMGSVANPPAAEDAPLGLRDIYDITKAQGEVAVLSGGGRGETSVTVIRPAVAYGPGDARRLWFFRAIASGRFWLIGDGANLIHPVFIDDLVEGMMAAFNSPHSAGKTYILGGERYLPLRDWIELIAAECGRRVTIRRAPYYPALAAASACEWLFRMTGAQPPIYRRYADFFMKSRAYSIELARRELGYQPKVGLEEGARRTLKWYMEQGLIPAGGGHPAGS